MSKKYLRQRRVFSPTLRKEIVGLIESGKLSVTAASREYQVSIQSIYNWIHRYPTYIKKGVVLVVDKKSQESKLQQMQIDFYQKYLEITSEYKVKFQFRTHCVRNSFSL